MNVPEQDLKRCKLGEVDSIVKLVGGLRYVRNIVTKSQGSHLEKDAGELFANFERGCGPESFLGGPGGKVLVGKFLLDEKSMPSFPGASWRDNWRGPGSIKVIPWERYGAALVIATDPNMIGDCWLAFVPLESLKDLQVGGGA